MIRYARPSMSQTKPAGDDPLLVTRQSLVERLADWGDQQRWQEFFDLYSRLIYGVARRAGLTEVEAQEAVQETVLSVAKNVTKYNPAAGSFKGWLLQLTRWRIAEKRGADHGRE